MKKENLEDIIVELIERNDEGSYWDYKQDFSDNNDDLVHDIICFANNTENRDAYLIYGVDDKGTIVGVEHSTKKKNKADITNLLQSVHFVEDRPLIDMTSFQLEGHTVCVLIIKKSPHVPFYLTYNYRAIHPFQVYTRVGDTNTPKNSEADLSDIEKLWKIRFGLTPNPVERVIEYIRDIRGWEKQKETHWFYREFPEFTIVSFEDPDEMHRNPAYTAIHTNASSGWDIVQVKYHQTVLMEYSVNYLDGFRARVIHPEMGSLSSVFGYRFEYPRMYLYYFHNSPKLLLSQFLNHFMPPQNQKWIWEMHLEYVAVFDDESEQDRFHAYLRSHLSEFKQELPAILNEICVGYAHEFSDQERLNIKKDMTVPKAVVKWLKRFRDGE